MRTVCVFYSYSSPFWLNINKNPFLFQQNLWNKKKMETRNTREVSLGSVLLLALLQITTPSSGMFLVTPKHRPWSTVLFMERLASHLREVLHHLQICSLLVVSHVTNHLTPLNSRLTVLSLSSERLHHCQDISTRTCSRFPHSASERRRR